LIVEAGADIAAIGEFALHALREHERCELPSFERGLIADNDEFPLVDAFGFEPGLRAAYAIGGIRLLRNDAFKTLFGERFKYVWTIAFDVGRKPDRRVSASE